jgi:hypothetical protein
MSAFDICRNRAAAKKINALMNAVLAILLQEAAIYSRISSPSDGDAKKTCHTIFWP